MLGGPDYFRCPRNHNHCPRNCGFVHVEEKSCNSRYIHFRIRNLWIQSRSHRPIPSRRLKGCPILVEIPKMDYGGDSGGSLSRKGYCEEYYWGLIQET
jgi:hypothetical protein